MNELFESHIEFILQKFGVKQVHKGESLGGGGGLPYETDRDARCLA